VEVSTKQCTPRLANFEASAEEDFVHARKAKLKFLTVLKVWLHFMVHIYVVVW